MLETGHSYERAKIEEWLERRRTCPKTGKQLRSVTLIPNYSLRSSIQDWQNAQAAAAAAAAVTGLVLCDGFEVRTKFAQLRP